MMTEHLRKVVEQLAEQPDDVQEKYAAELELDLDLHEQDRIAAQLADPHATDLEYLLARAEEQSAQGLTIDLDEFLDTIDDTDE